MSSQVKDCLLSPSCKKRGKKVAMKACLTTLTFDKVLYWEAWDLVNGILGFSCITIGDTTNSVGCHGFFKICLVECPTMT